MQISEGNRVLWLDPESNQEYKATVQRVYKQKARIQLGDFSERSVYLGELTLAPLPYKTIGEAVREKKEAERAIAFEETVREQPLFPNNGDGETVREQPLLPNKSEGKTVREQPLLPNKSEGKTVREQPLLPNNGDGETVREQPLLPNKPGLTLEALTLEELEKLSRAIECEIAKRRETTETCWIEEKFITRNGKKHGPYLYERWRENGRLKSRYLGLKSDNDCKLPLNP